MAPVSFFSLNCDFKHRMNLDVVKGQSILAMVEIKEPTPVNSTSLEGATGADVDCGAVPNSVFRLTPHLICFH